MPVPVSGPHALLKPGGFGSEGSLFTQYIAETEHRSRHGHVGELYREAEVHRLVRLARAKERRTRLDLTRPTAWVAATLAAAGARV